MCMQLSMLSLCVYYDLYENDTRGVVAVAVGKDENKQKRGLYLARAKIYFLKDFLEMFFSAFKVKIKKST